MITTRREKDPLGPLDVPSDALYGVQTQRAKQNFQISGLAPLEAFVVAQVWIKKAAALTHKETGRLDPGSPTPSSRRPTRCSAVNIEISSSSTHIRPARERRST